ncbi:hypothetical protein Vadar_030712 [Vaccinium darrowii]|uniref:Uncharacterized protein n=1 Tax=Vaccinium darrowii TaxID=229202 RepID=A0ACB7Y313_9ERIC|nr:hypothetical protein Vadar_030712 [Vaccinium darrowii]
MQLWSSSVRQMCNVDSCSVWAMGFCHRVVLEHGSCQCPKLISLSPKRMLLHSFVTSFKGNKKSINLIVFSWRRTRRRTRIYDSLRLLIQGYQIFARFIHLYILQVYNNSIRSVHKLNPLILLNLEEAVRRETWEETGIEVEEVTDHSLQPWPGVVAPEARVLEPWIFSLQYPSLTARASK